VARDDVIVESILYIGRLVRPAVEPTEVCVVLREEECGLNRVYLGVDLEVVRRADGRRGW